MGPTGNSKGTYYWYDLRTCRIVQGNRWTALPTPDNVIDMVNNMSAKQKPTNDDIGAIVTLLVMLAGLIVWLVLRRRKRQKLQSNRGIAQ